MAAPEAVVFDPSCHWDCFGDATCIDGVVTAFLYAPVPCQYWTGSCPIVATHVCEKGCVTEGWIYGWGPQYGRNPEVLCVEGAPKEEGDPCAAQEDCLPTPASPGPGFSVINTYLRCDVDAGVCVASEPATIPGWLSQCGPEIQKLAGTGGYGFRLDPDCPGGVCNFYAEANGCLWQGCTGVCEGDHECPPDSVCAERAVYLDGGWQSVCKPGQRHVIGYGLSCF